MRNFSDYCSEDFKKYFYASVQGREKRTIEEYIGYVSLICNKCMKDFLELTVDDVSLYFQSLNSQLSDGKITRRTIGTRLSCYRTISQYIEDRLDGYVNPFTRVIRPASKPDFDPNKIPTMKELDMLMSEAKADPQLYVILALATRVGLSAASIMSLRYNMIMCENDRVYLFFQNKSDFKKDTYIQLPEDVRDIVISYCGTRLGTSDEHLFKNKWGNPMSLVNLDAAVAGVTKKCSLDYTLKDFRARAILEMAKAGVGLDSLMAYTGLSSTRLESFVKSKDILSGVCPADLVNYRLVTE